MQTKVRGNTLRKSERLFERKAIETLFDKGRSFSASPMRVLWIINKKDSSVPVRAAFSVPSKTFRRSVDRNQIKRRMREAYRKHKMILFDAMANKHSECLLIFIYTARVKMNYSEIESKIVVTLHHLLKNTVSEKGAGSND